MGHQKAKTSHTALLVSGLLSAVMLIGGSALIEDLTGQIVLSRLLWPLVRLLFFITVGLCVGQIIEASGWTKTLAYLTRPFFRFGNLGDRCGAAFMTAFVSGVTANAMLLDFYIDGKISKTQLFLSNFVNQFPAFFLHLPTTFFIVIPLTGWAGALYFLITFLAVALRTFILLLYGHLQPSIRANSDRSLAPETPNQNSERANKVWQTISKKLPRRLSGVVMYVVPIYIAVFMVNAMGAFTATRNWLAQYVATTIIPMESLSIVILSFAAEFTSGFAAAGALMEAGMLTVKQTVIALLIGNIVAFPIRALRHQLPRYMGIFAPKMGMQLLLLGQGFRVTSLIIVGVMYYYLA